MKKNVFLLSIFNFYINIPEKRYHKPIIATFPVSFGGRLSSSGGFRYQIDVTRKPITIFLSRSIIIFDRLCFNDDLRVYATNGFKLFSFNASAYKCVYFLLAHIRAY